MEPSVTKEVFIGDEGATAEVTQESRSTHSLDAQYAQTLMKNAGKLFCPIGFNYLGSAVVHYYSKQVDGGDPKQFTVACQTNVSDVAEGLADLGWKQLKSALMGAYGRKEPERRK